MRKRPRLAPSRPHLAQSIRWIQQWGQSKFNRLAITLSVVDICVSCDFVRVDAKSTSSFETENIFQEEVFFTLGKVLAM